MKEEEEERDLSSSPIVFINKIIASSDTVPSKVTKSRENAAFRRNKLDGLVSSVCFYPLPHLCFHGKVVCLLEF